MESRRPPSPLRPGPPPRGIDADEGGPLAGPDLDQFPGIQSLRAGLSLRDRSDFGAECRQAQHGPRIGAMGGDDLTRAKHHIGQEALVAPNQTALDPGRGETQ